MTERALFLSRTSGTLAAEAAAIRAGFDAETAASRSRVYPVYRRGELKGFEAWYPVDASVQQPVMKVS